MPSTGQVRIIGGRWRGRRLLFPERRDLRPTGDRLRETLFNWLAPELADAHCLDLFAGSGALGIEAVSRRASTAILVEKDPGVAECLRRNCSQLGASEIVVVQADAVDWLRGVGSAIKPFDIVFLDPPFETSLLAAVIGLLANGGWLASGALIYMESRLDQHENTPDDWVLHRSTTAGQVMCRLFRVV